VADRIPLFKVFMAQYAALQVERTLDSGYTGQGPRVEEFEERVRRFEGLKRAPLATMTGTHALDLAYHLAGIGPGDKVISTPMTCTATNIPLLHRGAKIIWADVDRVTGLISYEHVKHLYQNGHGDAKAIIAVDWAGRVCDYLKLRSIGPAVIQDGAHSFNSKAKHSGHYRMWSFGAIKHLNCGGDGGALEVMESDQDRARLLRWYGLDRSQNTAFRCEQDIVEPGYKYGMNDVAATIGLANIRYANWIVKKTRQNASYFHAQLQDIETIRMAPFDAGCSYWFFPLLVTRRIDFVEHLDAAGIDASEVHSRNDFKHVFPSGKELFGLEEFSLRQVNIPCGWWLNSIDCQRIIEAVRSFK